MKKLFVLLVVALATTTFAQTGFTPGQSYLGSQISHISGCEGAQPNTYYTYQGLNAAGGPHFTYCNTCPGQGGGSTNTTNTVVVPAPVVNVTTVDKEYNYAALSEEIRHNKKSEKQVRNGHIKDALLGLAEIGLGVSNQVGLWKGMYQSNVNTNVFTTAGTTLPTPTDYFPVQTTGNNNQLPAPAPGNGNGPVFIPTWNTNSVPAGQTPPIIPQQPGDWGPTGG